VIEQCAPFCLTALVVFILGSVAAWILCRVAAQSDKRMEERKWK